MRPWRKPWASGVQFNKIPGGTKLALMTRRRANLPIEIEMEAGAMISNLEAAGWIVSESLYDPEAFGNWYVDLSRLGLAIRLTKDRSQYLIEGPREELEAAGLWKAFDNLQEFQQAVVKWAVNPPAAKL